MTVSEVIKALERTNQPDAQVLVSGLPGQVEFVMGYPDSLTPAKVYITSDPMRD